MKPRYLTACMREVASVIGADGVDRLVAAFGGVEIYVPALESLHSSHPLAKALGLDAARRLAAHMQVRPASSRKCRGGQARGAADAEDEERTDPRI